MNKVVYSFFRGPYQCDLDPEDIVSQMLCMFIYSYVIMQL